MQPFFYYIAGCYFVANVLHYCCIDVANIVDNFIQNTFLEENFIQNE